MPDSSVLKDVVDTLSGASESALSSIKERAEALAATVEGEAREIAEDIRGYGDRILITIDRRAKREITLADANVSVRNWKQASKSALKKLKVFSEWEAYDQFWGHVTQVFKFVETLLGVITV